MLRPMVVVGHRLFEKPAMVPDMTNQSLKES